MYLVCKYIFTNRYMYVYVFIYVYYLYIYSMQIEMHMDVCMHTDSHINMYMDAYGHIGDRPLYILYLLHLVVI